jgi:chromosome segregation ATPase
MSEARRGAGGRWVMVASLSAAALLLAALIWQQQRFARLQQAGAGQAGELRSIRQRAEKAEREAEALRALTGMPRPAEEPAEEAHARRVTPTTEDLERARLAIQLRESLKEANATISELETRIGSLEERLKKATDENQRLSGEERDLRDRVDTTIRLVDAVQAELKSRNERLAQLELQNRSLRDAAATAADRATKAAQAIREVEEINRRRETYLTSVLRRFRDLTDQYRAIAMRIDSEREGRTALPGELSRIQSTVAMAEEDLKQIASLSAQASRAQARIGR